jgi:hypothetical protein
VLRIECQKCGRSGRYRLADLITRYGRLFAFTADVTANSARKQRSNENDPCGGTLSGFAQGALTDPLAGRGSGAAIAGRAWIDPPPAGAARQRGLRWKPVQRDLDLSGMVTAPTAMAARRASIGQMRFSKCDLTEKMFAG